MMLALDKGGDLHIFVSAEEAERALAASDVQNGACEFCDARGQRYVPTYIRPPRESRKGPAGTAEGGPFRLAPQGEIHPSLLEEFIGRTRKIEGSSFPTIQTLEALREELDRRTGRTAMKSTIASHPQPTPVKSNIPEADWKLFRQIQPLALNRYCEKTFQDIQQIATDERTTPHERYLALGKLMRRRDGDLARGFYDMRRSAALSQLVIMQSCGVITEEEYMRFSPETRARILKASKGE